MDYKTINYTGLKLKPLDGGFEDVLFVKEMITHVTIGGEIMIMPSLVCTSRRGSPADTIFIALEDLHKYRYEVNIPSEGEEASVLVCSLEKEE